MKAWKKRGLVFCPDQNFGWMQTHAAVPIAERIEGDLYRIYFSTRDAANRSRTGYVVIDIQKPQAILELSENPVLDIGALGTFDDSGAMATWLAEWNGQRYLYYIGWNLGVTVPFRNSIGLAMGSPTRDFEKIYEGPIVDRTVREPHFCASCCVIPGADVWRMWYLSCTGWEVRDGRPSHHYHIKYAESDDGVDWRRTGQVAIDFEDSQEYAISRPSVLYEGGLWRMWYSHRGAAYRIGYAESENGIDWSRRDALAGISVSETGWDSEMIEYPHVFQHDGQTFMLYNGNGYGATGVGLAVLESQ
ncbi:hypothetical protein [Acidovorax sp. NCPPB 3576]|uniref:hypothetical protein n=1 Tax=Acidovorax sp. NCPPB 3576 TaxID=2940488 RepID=UPI00234BD427|nr:hypothetical protein [Acidovorax sp. NCPPB 3576]WCM88437.1 hypothetical protein M5C98_24410 [Acidovorax sp. NCPPB 3576]